MQFLFSYIDLLINLNIYKLLAGIYIHIPFCKQACHYCNFHFSTSLKLKDKLVDAICSEIDLRKDYLQSKKISSIYFGGGTPSLLSDKDLDKIFNRIHSIFQVQKNAELTLEANPDDLSIEQLHVFKKHGINRLSIGVQSFDDKELRYMNRSHNAQQALKSVNQAQELGFHLSVDLIFGIPGQSNLILIENANQLLKLKVEHISAYALTIEPKTALHHFVQKGKRSAPNEEQQTAQFHLLDQLLSAQEYDHYEISNYAKDNYYAVHNSSYWNGNAYLGIGPSAHSYNGLERSWNIANNPKYIKALNEGHYKAEVERLSDQDLYNEKVIISLRTMWGLQINSLSGLADKYQTYFKRVAEKLINQGDLKFDVGQSRYFIPKSKWMVSDAICRALMFVEAESIQRPEA